MYIQTTTCLLEQLAVLIATGGPYKTTKIGLYFSDVPLNQNNVLADFGDLTAGGIFTNEQAVVYGTPFINDQGQAEVRAAMLNWITTYTPPANLIAYGYLEIATDNTTVLRAERFAQSYTFNRASQEFSLVPALRVSN